jgi:mannose-1-phosphate guanylyltransferase
MAAIDDAQEAAMFSRVEAEQVWARATAERKTAARMSDVSAQARSEVVAIRDYVASVLEQLRAVSLQAIASEPVARPTAASEPVAAGGAAVQIK